jgi:hypothetical protein
MCQCLVHLHAFAQSFSSDSLVGDGVPVGLDESLIDLQPGGLTGTGGGGGYFFGSAIRSDNGMKGRRWRLVCLLWVRVG